MYFILVTATVQMKPAVSNVKCLSLSLSHRACLRRRINLSKEEMREKSREQTSVTPKRTGAGQSADTRLKRAIR